MLSLENIEILKLEDSETQRSPADVLCISKS